MSRHCSRFPGSRLGGCRYRSRSSSRCPFRYRRPQGADTGPVPAPVTGKAKSRRMRLARYGSGTVAGNPGSSFGTPTKPAINPAPATC